MDTFGISTALIALIILIIIIGVTTKNILDRIYIRACTFGIIIMTFILSVFTITPVLYRYAQKDYMNGKIKVKVIYEKDKYGKSMPIDTVLVQNFKL